MPLTGRRRLKRKNAPVSPEKCKPIFSMGTILHITPNDLPWYCHGVINDDSKNYVRTYLSSKSLGLNKGNHHDCHRPSTGLTFGHDFRTSLTSDSTRHPRSQPCYPTHPLSSPSHGHCRSCKPTSPPAPPIIVYRDSGPDRPNDLTVLFSDSSVPGLREICHSDSFLRKIVWFIVFTLLGFLTLRDQLLSEFYNYPVTVDVRLRESRKLPFPAVTVCNLNIVRFSALCNSTLNFSMPIELQEKLCGTVATALNSKGNASIEDINDIGDIKDENGGGTSTLADRCD